MSTICQQLADGLRPIIGMFIGNAALAFIIVSECKYEIFNRKKHPGRNPKIPDGTKLYETIEKKNIVKYSRCGNNTMITRRVLKLN